MAEPKRKRTRTPNHPPEHELGNFKLFRMLDPLLERLQGIAQHPNRNFEPQHYITYILFYFFNPLITSMRGLQQVSDLPRVQKKLGVPRFSFGSFSEMASKLVFNADVVAGIVRDLAKQVQPVHQKLDPRMARFERVLTAVDGTLLAALPRMVWALWLDEKHRAAKAHVQFEILKKVGVGAEVTAGNGSETAALRRMLEAGRCYILDRGYATYRLFQEIIDAGSSFVARIKSNSVYKVVEERALSDADRRAGVARDVVVWLGCPSTAEALQQQVRLVTVITEDGTELILCADLLDVEADLIALFYKSRWQVELFFRWLKSILGVSHLISERENGVALQIYAALIASMMVVLYTGCKPTKRTYELLCLCFQGWATPEDLECHVEKSARKEARKGAKAAQS